MSKAIRMTPEMIESCKRDFEEAIQKVNLLDGKLSFIKQFDSVDRKATLYFMPEAYTKMVMLVRNFDKEVAWHGTAIRGDGDDYFVTDIIVYPQEVTGTTVTTDQVEYEKWLLGLDDDVFNSLRFQGHSHVNMSVSPSGVDTADQAKIVEQLKDDMFYIFFIMNKDFKAYAKIYDMQKNIMFEDKDITWQMYSGNIDMQAFLKEAKDIVRIKQYTYQGNTYYTGGKVNQPSTPNIIPITQTKKEEKKDPPKTDTKNKDMSKKKKTTAKGDSAKTSPQNSSSYRDDDEYLYWMYGDRYMDPFYYK